jgi:subtilisin family serine protease
VVCVGAVDRDYERWSFSNDGLAITIYAPGDAVLVASPKIDVDLEEVSGTSVASPYVAGVMAIFRSYEHIDNDAGKVLNRLMQDSVQTALHPSVHQNILVQTGLNDPRRDPAQPYVGPSSFYWP